MQEKLSIEQLRAHFGHNGQVVQEQPPVTSKNKQSADNLPDGPVARNKSNNRYKNTKVRIDGILFDSLKEGQYYKRLKLKQEQGLIRGFLMQVRYNFVVNGEFVCSYTADFIEIGPYDIEVIDVKSFITRRNPTYRLKIKLLSSIYGISIVEK